MNQLAEKVRAVEEDIEREKGPLNLLALFEREDLFQRWDFVVSAPWAKYDQETLGYLASVIRRHLEPAEMTLLARIVILPAEEDPVRAITANYSVEHGRVEMRNPAQFGLPATHGYIITSRRAA